MKNGKFSVFILIFILILMQTDMTAVFGEETADLSSDLEFYYNFNGGDFYESKGLQNEELVSMDDSILQKNDNPVGENFESYIEFEEDGMDYIFAPEGMLDGFTDELTVSIWINVSKCLPWQRIIDFGQGSAYITLALWPEGEGGRVSALFATDGSETQVNLYKEGLQTIELNKWHHVALSIENRIMSLYVDGVNIVSGDVPSDLTIFEGSLEHMIGKSRYAQDPLFEGAMDEIRIYKRALNIDEITALASGNLDAPKVEHTPKPTEKPEASKTEPVNENTPAQTDTSKEQSRQSGNGSEMFIIIALVVALITVILTIILISRKKRR